MAVWYHNCIADNGAERGSCYPELGVEARCSACKLTIAECRVAEATDDQLKAEISRRRWVPNPSQFTDDQLRAECERRNIPRPTTVSALPDDVLRRECERRWPGGPIGSTIPDGILRAEYHRRGFGDSPDLSDDALRAECRRRNFAVAAAPGDALVGVDQMLQVMDERDEANAKAELVRISRDEWKRRAETAEASLAAVAPSYFDALNAVNVDGSGQTHYAAREDMSKGLAASMPEPKPINWSGTPDDWDLLPDA